METLVLVMHILAAVGVVGLVLIQHGKGADVGAAFGSGSAGSLFGSTGSANFLSRTTAVLAVVFFVTSMGLSYLSGQKTEHKGVMETQPARQQPAVPAPQDAPVPVPGGDGSSRAREIPK